MMDLESIRIIFGSSIETLRMHCRHVVRLLRTRDVLQHQLNALAGRKPKSRSKLAAEEAALSQEIERLEGWREELMLTKSKAERTLASASDRLRAKIKSAINPHDYANPDELRQIAENAQADLEKAGTALDMKRRRLDQLQKRLATQPGKPDRKKLVERLEEVVRELSSVDEHIDSLLRERVQAMHPSTVAHLSSNSPLTSLRRLLKRHAALEPFGSPQDVGYMCILSANDIAHAANRGRHREQVELGSRIAMRGLGTAAGRRIAFEDIVPIRLQVTAMSWDGGPVVDLLARKAMEEFASGFAEVSNINGELATTAGMCKDLLRQLRENLGIPVLSPDSFPAE